jgi:hypothetical protein
MYPMLAQRILNHKTRTTFIVAASVCIPSRLNVI